jgi:hypothetical protein
VFKVVRHIIRFFWAQAISAVGGSFTVKLASARSRVIRQTEGQTTLTALRAMPRRNSLNNIRDLNDLTGLNEVMIDKRLGQRASAKKNRHNRHYEKQFIRNTLAHPLAQHTLDDPITVPAAS